MNIITTFGLYSFSAGYETGVSGYKHVYFNSTRQTLAIWIITVFAVIGLYEGIRHVATLLYTGRFEFGFRTRLRIVQNVYLNYLFCFLIDNYSARIEQLTNTLCLNTDFKRKSQKKQAMADLGWPLSFSCPSTRTTTPGGLTSTTTTMTTTTSGGIRSVFNQTS